MKELFLTERIRLVVVMGAAARIGLVAHAELERGALDQVTFFFFRLDLMTTFKALKASGQLASSGQSL